MLEKCLMTGFADEIDANFDVQLSVLKSLGQTYLELRGADGVNVADFTAEKAVQLRGKLRERGIGVSAIGSPIGKIGVGDDFVPHFETYKRIVDLAHTFDTRFIRMFSFYLPEEDRPEQYTDRVFERMARLVDYAKSEDVVLLHENEKGIYGAKAHGCRVLMDKFYGDHFQAIFDFANFVQCHENTLEAYELLKDFIAYIHVKDALWESGEVVLPGQGDGNLAAILADLDRRGFTGFLSMEPHLFHFAGFDALEKGEAVERKEGSGSAAYRAAFGSLRALLEQ